MFSGDDIRHYVQQVVPKQRAEAFFKLGLGLGRIVHLPKGLPIVRAFSQLMEEWEYYIAGSAMQSVKYVMAKSSPCLYPQSAPLEGMTDLTRPSVYKFQSSITFEYLDDVNIGLELDYLEVLPALCEVLYQVYDKLHHEETFRYDGPVASCVDGIVNLNYLLFQQLCGLRDGDSIRHKNKAPYHQLHCKGTH